MENMTQAELIKQRLFPVVSRNVPLEGLVAIGTGGRMIAIPTRENVEAGLKEVFERRCSSSYRDQLIMSWEVCFSVAVDLIIKLDDMKVALSWSSTYRDVNNALASVALYSAATVYAAKIQATMDDLSNSRDFKEAKP